MHVKPASPTAVIRDPRTGRKLPAAGAEVPDSSFWQRRLLHGDVVPVEPSAQASPELASAIDGATPSAGPLE